MPDDRLKRFRDWWLQNYTAPQSGITPGVGFFQHRDTGNPGKIMDLLDKGLLGQTIGTPVEAVNESLNYGPKTDIDTARGLVNLRSLWEDRASRYPGEEMIYVDPVAKPEITRHEAVHSLYNQIVPPEIAPKLNKLASYLDLFPGRDYERPQYLGTEAAAYETMSEPSEKGRKFIEAVIGSAKDRKQKDAAERLSNLYNRRKGSLGK